MKVEIEDLEVLFPYEYIYPEQYEYMIYLKQTIDAGGKSILEMPSGTGKTVCLLSLIIAYMLKNPSKYSKLVYCTRTVSEIEKVLMELLKLYKYYEIIKKETINLLSIGLASRKNMYDARNVDRKCHVLTSSITRNYAKSDRHELCHYYENFYKEATDFNLTSGVYSIDELRKYGQEKVWCPYFLARQSVLTCNILVYNYAYLVDPKISDIVSKNIESSSIIVFDEAHNIDNACIEAFNISIDQKLIISARSSLNNLKKLLEKKQKENETKLKNDYSLLLKGLKKIKSTQHYINDDIFLPNPVISNDLLKESIPGNIRRNEHFIIFLQRFVEYLAFRMCKKELIIEKPVVFFRNIYEHVGIDIRSCRFSSERLRILINSLELDNNVDITIPLGIISSFATIISSYDKGFCIIYEPWDPSTPNLFQPKVHLNCMDSCIALKYVFDKFNCIIITSGTLSPLDMYPKLLNFQPCIVASLSMTLARPSVCPIIVTRGIDQGILSCRFNDRYENSVIKNYGCLIAEICNIVPDGVVCFFTSYRHLETSIHAWSECELLNKMQQKKLIFIETPNYAETALALESYKRACECGRGGLLFSVARGKVSEGIDFYDHLGRAVIVVGVPFVYTLSSILRTRLEYLRDNYDIRERDFLTFDALRHTAQCIGRVIRGKDDYAIMILADERFSKPSKIQKLPKWIQQNITSANVNISSDEAITLTKTFLLSMGENLTLKHQLGISLLSEQHLKSEQFKIKLNALQQTSIQNFRFD